jgi:hypothetical protein
MHSISEKIELHRRRFFGTTAIGIAATAGAWSLLPTGAGQTSSQGDSPMASTGADAIRPFRINVPDGDLVDLRRRSWGLG